MQPFSIPEFLKQLPLFQDLNNQELASVENIAMSRFAPKKSIIFTEGSEKEAVYFIQDGLVKTYKTDEDGHEQIVSILKSADMFPHTGLFHQMPYPATAEAIIDTQLLAIPVRLFEPLMISTPSIAVKMMRVMGETIRELQAKLQMLTGQDARHRVLSFLLKLAEQHGKQDGNRITIDLPMTHQEFASTVGTTRETISRLLNQLAKEKILQADRSRITILDPQALREQAL